MKVYWTNEGITYVGEVPDGAMCMAVSPRPGIDSCITSIDFNAKTFVEAVGDPANPSEVNIVPFPELWYRVEDVAWTFHRDAPWHGKKRTA